MSLRYIFGETKAGKTELCYNEIIQDCDCRRILIVPEQYSLESERSLISRMEGKSAVFVNVLSFKRLAYFCFSEIGRPSDKLLDEPSKHMLIKRLLDENINTLLFYSYVAKKDGFVEKLSKSFSEFRQYCLSSEEILNLAKNISPNEQSLSVKLKDLALLYGRYNDYIQSRYLSDEDALDLLFMHMDEVSLFDNAKIWLDGFLGFTPQELRIISKLMKRCEVSLTLPLGEKVTIYNDISDTDPLNSIKRTVNELTKTANKQGTSISTVLLYAKKTDADKKVCIFSGINKYEEIRFALNGIQKLLNEGYSCKDIAIITTPSYYKSLKATLSLVGIPVFVDENRPVFHPLTETISGILDIVAYDFSYESVFRFLKTYMFFTPDECDILENYVLEYGIANYRWDKTFMYGGAKYNLLSINLLREKLLKMLAPFKDFVTNKKSFEVRYLCEKLFECLISLGIKNLLSEQNDKVSVSVWNSVCDLFDNLVAILSEQKMTIYEFSSLVTVGFSAIDVGVIPPMQEQVIIGDLERSRLGHIKALFVLGLNEGVMPGKKEDSGLFSDDERTFLLSTGTPLAPDIKTQISADWFLIRTAVQKPTQELFISYSQSSVDGKSLRASHFLPYIQKLYPQHEYITLQPDTDEFIISDEFSAESLSQTTVASYYGNNLSTSASLLESYANCPFAYFLKHNLNAKKRKLYEVEAMDIGNLFHLILDSFMKHLEKIGKAWNEADEKDVEDFVEGFTTDEFEIFNETAANNYLLRRLKRIAKASLNALTNHIKAGKFRPLSTEFAFKEPITELAITLSDKDGGEQRVVLRGRIDRIDIWENGKTHYVKIIDYKSGKKTFDIEDIYSGMQLQLILYLDVFIKSLQARYDNDNLDIRVLPGGVFYFNIKDPLVPFEKGKEDKRESIFKMSGLVLSDKELIDAMDTGLVGQSSIIPVYMKKDGEPGSVSRVTDKEGFDNLRSFVFDKIQSLGSEIKRGSIPKRPYKKGKKYACDYCDYKSICRIER